MSFVGVLPSSSRDQLQRAAFGVFAETAPRHMASAPMALVDGTVYFVGVELLVGDVVRNLACIIGVAGVAVTRAKLGLYAKTGGAPLAQTADQSAAWQSTGPKLHAVTAAYAVTTTDVYYFAMLAKATTTMPQPRGSYQNGVMNGALGAGVDPIGAMAGQADLPANAVIGAGDTGLWLAAA